MKYGNWLKEGSKIGVCAPSFGIVISPYKERYESSKKKLKQLGYHLKETESVYLLEEARSNTAKQRAKEFMDVYLDDSVDFISSVAGGELMMEILPYIDFEKIKQAKPKFFMGFSDNTCLTFLLPILSDVAAIYGPCTPTFGMQEWHPALQHTFDMLSGKTLIEESYDMYEKQQPPYIVGSELDGYQCNEVSTWKSLSKEDIIHLEGRLIGGCLDVISILVGTQFDQVNSFLEKYKDDGFIWFLEACDLNILSQIRTLWQLRQAGYFKYCKGILYGRPVHSDECFGIDLKKALQQATEGMDIPVVYDVDFGHIPPSITLISGSYVKIEYKNGKGKINTELK